MNQPQLTIVVPTYQEVENIELLTERVFSTLREAQIESELIFVDDNSRDGSAELVHRLQADFPVSMVVREQERGLSTAVLRGFLDAKGTILLVMDADLSHPPERIPELYHLVERGNADFVIGSRYTAGGETKDWPFLRKLNSLIATLIARPLTSATDPMAGFFCLPRSVWENADQLNPLGYKIGLELMIKGRCSNVREIPITFADRHAGESKLNLKQQLLYLLHLKRLYRYKFPFLSALCFYVVPLAVLCALVVWMSR